jgi:hypothetical protein
MYVILAAVLIANSAGCAIYNVKSKYSKYRMEKDLKRYEYGIRSLLSDLEYSKSLTTRMMAAKELGEYSLNGNAGAREILLNIGIPGLIKILSEEEEDTIRATIIRSLSDIKPDDDVVINVYVESLEKGGLSEVDAAIMALKQLDYDLQKYVQRFVEKIVYGDTFDRYHGINVLRSLGRYAYSSLDVLRYTKENDPDEVNRMVAGYAIDDITKDYEAYIKGKRTARDKI